MRMGMREYEGKKVYYDKKGYALVCINRKDVKVHLLVWESSNGKKPNGHDIHHKDEDKGNFNLSNLELLTHSDHQRVHAGWIRKNGEWAEKPCSGCNEVFPIGHFYKRKGFTPASKCKNCHGELTRAWAKKNPEKKKRIALDYYYRSKMAGGKTNA